MGFERPRTGAGRADVFLWLRCPTPEPMGAEKSPSLHLSPLRRGKAQATTTHPWDPSLHTEKLRPQGPPQGDGEAQSLTGSHSC